MRLSDYIVDKSPNDEEIARNLVQEAERIHGTEAVSLTLGSFPDNKSRLKAVADLINTPVENPNNLENKPMIDVRGLRDFTTPEQWYGGLKELSLLGKPASFMATPITEALRAPFKYIAENVGENTSQTPPINTFAEYETIHPSDRAGLGLLLRDISNAAGIKTEPMADIKSEKYPKLSQFMKQMTDPVNVGGAALDVMAGVKIPNPKVISAGASAVGDVYSVLGKEVPPGVNRAMLSNKLPKMSLETATDYVRSLSKDKQKLAELERSGRIYNIGKMVQENPEMYFHPFKPNTIYENIMGDLKPDEATRIGSKGELSRMNRLQEGLIEEIPSDVYTVPREDLRLSALNELGEQGLEATQLESAQRFIDKNIPVTQPDPAKLKRISDVNEATWKIDDLDKASEAERMIRLNQLNMQKNALFNEASSTPFMVENPQYRPELNWLSDLEVIDSPTGENIFPKQRMENTTTVTPPSPEYTPVRPITEQATGVVRGYEPSGKVASPDPLSSIIDTITEQSLSADPLNAVKSQNILDIAQGKQNQPPMISNPEYQIAMGRAIEDISLINKEIENLSNQPTSSVNNSRLLRLIDEKQRLEGFAYENADPMFNSPDDYTQHIRNLNEEPIIYASDMRKLGNKLREPVMAGEVSTDIAARNAAGRALERAARKAQDQAMGFMGPADVTIYNQQNQKISDLLNLRDLTQGNLQNPALNAPTPWMPSTWARGINRYIKPGAQSLGSGLSNAIRSGTAGISTPILSASEFLNSKNGVNLFQIPRTSEGALQNIDLVKAKIEREFGPEVVMQMDSIKDSASFTNFMADLANMNPMAFTPDPYNRFDGVIKHPVLKTKALEDIVKNNKMNVLEKANSAEELMINSKFHGVQPE